MIYSWEIWSLADNFTGNDEFFERNIKKELQQKIRRIDVLKDEDEDLVEIIIR